MLFANLNVLKDMGYVTSEKITSDGKELELYVITTDGQDEWERTRIWLCRFLRCGARNMEKRKKLIAFFKELGFEFKISRFDDRLIAQKLVCLLELRGIDLGYSCSLYVRGPYSPDLTKDLYSHTHEFENLETGTRLNTGEKETAGELGRIFGLKPVTLEVSATYGYYAIRQDCNPFEALRQVKRLKPFYSEAQIALGISKAKEFLFRPTWKELEDLKEETDIWQSASIKTLEHGIDEKRCCLARGSHRCKMT